MSKDWRPISRAALATDYLVRNGFAEFVTIGCIRCIRLTSPLAEAFR